MKILITGADVEKKDNQYEVIYQGCVLLRNKLKEVCVITALSQETLETLLQQHHQNMKTM